MRRVAAAIAALLAAHAATAAPILVRSGEHSDFSRLVLPLPDNAGWHLSPTDDGYALEIDGLAGSALDLSRIFQFVPRTRLREATPGTGSITLSLTTDRDSHAEAFVTAAGQLVIDIRDGAPPAGPDIAVAKDASMAEPADGTAGDSPWDMPGPLPLGAVTAAIPADPNVALYWRDAPHAEPPVPDMERDQVPAATGSDAMSAMPVPPIAPPPIGDLEPALRHQLARAAAQGLVEFDAPHEQPAGGAEGDPAAAPWQLDAATSIDRAFADPAEGIAAGSDGGACPAPADYDIGDWGGEAEFAAGLAARRSGLVGEFDRPDPARVLALARYYVHSGFGAEAGLALTAFAARGPEAERVRTLARIVDGEPPDSPELRGFTACQSPVALWAVLARPALGPGDVVASGAVYEAFSGLPPHLRRSLGPPLAERFIAAGDIAMARSIRDAIERASESSDVAIRLTDARLASAEGRHDDSEVALDAALHDGGPQAEEAALLLAEARVRNADAGTQEFRDTVAALAFAQRRTGTGARYQRVHLLLLGLAGEWGAAFDALDKAADADRPALTRELFATLAAHADEPNLLQRYFAGRDAFEAAIPTPELRAAVADRLEKAGFPEDAASLREVNAGAGSRRDVPDTAPATPALRAPRSEAGQAGEPDPASALKPEIGRATDQAGVEPAATMPPPRADLALNRTVPNKAVVAEEAAELLAGVARSRADWQARLAAPVDPAVPMHADAASAEPR